MPFTESGGEHLEAQNETFKRASKSSREKKRYSVGGFVKRVTGEIFTLQAVDYSTGLAQIYSPQEAMYNPALITVPLETISDLTTFESFVQTAGFQIIEQS